MTLPREIRSSVAQTRALLVCLRNAPHNDWPSRARLRNMARQCLRHFPTDWAIARAFPDPDYEGTDDG